MSVERQLSKIFVATNNLSKDPEDMATRTRRDSRHPGHFSTREQALNIAAIEEYDRAAASNDEQSPPIELQLHTKKSGRLETTFPFTAEKLAETDNALKSGSMQKQDKQLGVVWRKRFFVLVDIVNSDTSHAVLYYFDNPESPTALSSISPKTDILSITTYAYSAKRKYGIEIEINRDGRRYWFMCETEKEQKEWINLISACKDYPTVKVKNGATRKEPPVKKPVLEMVAPAIPKKKPKHLERSNRVFSVQMNNVLVSEMMTPWYTWALDVMSIGGKVKKAPYLASGTGKIKRRFIQLSKDRSVLRWGCTTVEFSSNNMSDKKDKEIGENVLDRQVAISSVEKVIYGPRSVTWQKYLSDAKTKGSWRCLSIVVRSGSRQSSQRKRTLDLLFGSENETLAWFIGLNYLQSECKKKLLDEENALSFENKRDGAINKKLSDYKWAKLRLQVQEASRKTETNVSQVVDSSI